jgi:sirohydrochlorin cobaltochelatase
MSDEERALDAKVREWPRTADNDPYRTGIERLVDRVRAHAGHVRVEVAYNEFCAPSLPDTVDKLVREGKREIVLVATMMTPGGVHSEVEIPELVAELSAKHPLVRIVHAWPFDLDVVAKVLVAQAEGSFAD